MGRHGWILHTLARMLDWLRFRGRRMATAISAKVAVMHERDSIRRIGVGEVERAAIATVVDRIPADRRLSAAPASNEVQAGAMSSSSTSPTPSGTGAEPRPAEHDPDLPKDFPGAERFEAPVGSDRASASANLRSTSSGSAAAKEFAEDVKYTGGKEGEEFDSESAEDMTADDTFSFTPDPALDLVEDIEFVFEPEPHLGESASEYPANGEDTVVAVDRPDSESGAADLAAFGADGRTDSGPGWVKGNGSRECPDAFPIKGNANSHIYHLPGQASYAATIPELCFASEDAAVSEGYRPTRRSHAAG